MTQLPIETPCPGTKKAAEAAHRPRTCVPPLKSADQALRPPAIPDPLTLITSLESSVWLAKKGSHPVVSPQQAAIAAATFRADLVEKNFLYSAPLDPETLSQWAEDIALRHTAKHGFRTYDILHVSLALLLKCDCFWTFDLQARKLAALEGLATPG